MSHVTPLSLEDLLNRTDIWRGVTNAQAAEKWLASGYESLDKALNGGWPAGCLIEACAKASACDWWLLHPAVVAACKKGYCALVAPPHLPYAQGLAQLGVDLNRLLVVSPKNKRELIACLVELGQSAAFQVVIAWQQRFTLRYAELRKVHLAAQRHSGLCILFRPLTAQDNSSPAALRFRLSVQTDQVALHFFKQRGNLYQQNIALPVPDYWQKLLPHYMLGKHLVDGHLEAHDVSDAKQVKHE